MKRHISNSTLLAIAMAFSLLVSGIFSAAASRHDLEQKLVRLHILANSDSDLDQQLKLRVRDAILNASEELFEPYSGHEEACASLEGSMDRIRMIAEETLRENGCSDKVSCELEAVDFDERVYNGFTVPRGSYTALRVKIGSGQGHNWWCVMYPPLCIPCAGGIDEEILEKYGGELSNEDIIMMTECEDFEVRLFIVDLVRELLSEE